jgi:hypothetical protein
MKTMTKLSAILLAAAVSAAWPAMAQNPATTTTNAPAVRPARAPTRFGGVIASVDTTNMIVTLKGTPRNPAEVKVKVTSTTKITKDKEPGQLSDAVEGVRVTGSGKKGDDGVWTATTFNLMTKAPATKPPAAAPPAAPPQ